MAEEEPVTQEEEVEQTTPFLATEGNDKANLVLALASSILFDGSAEFTVSTDAFAAYACARRAPPFVPFAATAAVSHRFPHRL